MRTRHWPWRRNLLFVAVWVAAATVAHAAVVNNSSGTFASGFQGKGIAISFNSISPAVLSDFDRGLVINITRCGQVLGGLDSSPDNAPAGLAQAHDVDGAGGSTGVVSALTFLAGGVDDVETFGAFCLFKDSDGGFWAIERASVGVGDAGITACAPTDTFSPDTGCTPATTTGAGTDAVIKNYMSRRADQITANDPELARRLTSRSNGGDGVAGVGFTATGTFNNNRMNFATSLRQMVGAGERSKQKQRDELQTMMGLGPMNLSGHTDNEGGFDIWVQGSLAHVNTDTAKSDIGQFYVGADYRLSSSLLVGILMQYDWTDEQDDANSFKIDGKGWMAGPYVVAKLSDTLIFDGRVAWGQSDNNISPLNTYTDSFDTTRWLARGTLTGQFALNGVSIAPHVGILYFEEGQETYTDNTGAVIASQTISLGRVSFGPKVSTTYQTEDGMAISPYIGIKGLWDFDKADTVNVATGIASGSSNDVRARIDGGVSFSLANGWLISVPVSMMASAPTTWKPTVVVPA